MNKTAMENKKLELEEKKLKEEKRANNLQAATNVFGAVSNAAGRVIAGAASKGGNRRRNNRPIHSPRDWRSTNETFAFNTPEWYKKIIGTTPLNASVPTYFVQGRVAEWEGAQKADIKIAKICYYNAIGNQPNDDTELSTSDANYALSYFYSQTLQNNSRTPTEEPAEFGLYLFCWTDVAWLIERCKVALSIAAQFESQNPVFAKGIVSALGFKYSDVIQNRVAYQSKLNTLISEFNINAAVPKGMNYFYRKMYLARALIRDMKSNLAAWSVYRQINVWQLNDAENFASETSWAPANSDAYMSNVLTLISQLMTPLKESTIAINIKANILSAVDKTNLEQLTPLENINEFWKYSVVDSDMEREQLANITTVPNGFTYIPRSGNLYVSTNGYLVQGTAGEAVGLRFKVDSGIHAPTGTPTDDEIAKFNTIIGRHSQYLNFYHEDITPDDIIESSRFKPSFYYTYINNNGTLHIATCGTEVVDCIALQTYDDLDSQTAIYFRTTAAEDQPGTNSSSGGAEVKTYDLISNLDWAPLYFRYSTYDVKSVTPKHFILGDVGKTVHYPTENNRSLNSSANKSLFALDPRVFKQGF